MYGLAPESAELTLDDFARVWPCPTFVLQKCVFD